jgi:hypothetical protein
MLVSTCACGDVRLFIEDEAVGQVLECHCRQCQSFHGAASVHFICTDSLRVVDKKKNQRRRPSNANSSSTSTTTHGEESLEVAFASHCDSLSLSLRRMFCRRCFSRLYSVVTRPEDDEDDATSTTAASPPRHELLPSTAASPTVKLLYLVNVGPLVDQTIPRHIFSILSQARYSKLRGDLLPYWATADEDGESLSTALHGSDDEDSPNNRRDELVHRGGCPCGECRYEFRAAEATEVLHCYCRLCRRHSGSLYMSWIPIQTLAQHFRWTSMVGAALAVTRPTDSGCRYFCSKCGTNLAILYDEEATDDEKTSWIWVSGGSLDLCNPALVFERRAHIYCRYKPRWFDIPDDDLSQC